MSFLPANSAILIAGGRNDSLCKENITPLLNDLYLFLLDQKVWIRVKHSVKSDKFDHIGNHSMGVLTDGEYYEKVVIFGGILNIVEKSEDGKADAGQVSSFLSNKSYIISVQ
jgi:hypothetical protein